MPSFVDHVILYHTTSFGTAEHLPGQTAAPSQTGRARPGECTVRDQIVRDETARDHAGRSAERAQSAALRIRAWLTDGADPAPAGLVLTGPAAVAWACGGVAPPVDRTAATDLVWAVFTPDGSAALITTNVEADRIRDEYGPAAHGFAELMIVPWQDAVAFVQAAERFAGRAGRPAGRRRAPRVRGRCQRGPRRAPAGAVGRRASRPRRPRPRRRGRAAVSARGLAAGRARSRHPGALRRRAGVGRRGRAGTDRRRR